MLYRMITGRLPIEKYHPACNFNPDLDEPWDEFIRRAIASEVKDRFANADEMIKAFETLCYHWAEKKESICRVEPNAFFQKQTTRNLSVKLRSNGIKVRPRHARTMFSIDHLWRSLTPVNNDFRVNEDETITDKATGLLWQRSGCQYPLTWHQAKEYIQQLNKNSFAERCTWRLPTVNELMSLLTETSHSAVLCIEPVFDQKQKWLWSCDRQSFMSAWYVSLDLGFVYWQDFSAYYYVRAVCEDN